MPDCKVEAVLAPESTLLATRVPRQQDHLSDFFACLYGFDQLFRFSIVDVYLGVEAAAHYMFVVLEV